MTKAALAASDPAHSAGPSFYYHSANCATIPYLPLESAVRPMLELCRAALAEHGGKPFRVEHLRSHPFAQDLYFPDPVPVGFYRID